MMYKKRLIILFSILLFNLILKGQDSCSINAPCEKYLNKAKINAYKAIILSKELQSTTKCHIVTIQSVSLNMKYQYPRGFYDIEETPDTISVDSLRKLLPKSYWIYKVNDRLTNLIEGEEYINYFQKSDTIYNPNYTDSNICDFSYDIIKIYEPMDKWSDVYSANVEVSSSKVVIPIKYESFINKPKYLFYEIKLFAGGGVESVKVTEIK